MCKSRTLRRSLKRLYCNSHSEGLSRTAQASWWNDKYDRLLHLDCIRQSCQHAVLLLFLARQQLNPSSAEHGASDPLPTALAANSRSSWCACHPAVHKYLFHMYERKLQYCGMLFCFLGVHWPCSYLHRCSSILLKVFSSRIMLAWHCV